MTRAMTNLKHLVPENSVRFIGHATHSHEEPHLIHVAVGAAHLDVAGEAVTLHARESLWLAPRVPHAARYEPGSLVLGPFLSPGTVPPTPVYRLGHLPALTTVMTTILGVAPQTSEQVAHLRSALDEILTDLVTEHFALNRPRHPVGAAIAREAAISHETLGAIAARHGISARQVQRIFADETGFPFHRWRVRARLNAALARLRAGESVTRAATAAGFGTRSGLLKALSRETGGPAGPLLNSLTGPA
ncbi:helix-turn-helix domain-containing protein [Arthrobacter woluwensis]|uniref:Helix-turn-helix domain-containing protein n=1 Tax=Arthrobacter woluwensis TaxID=156980 RepID=A0A1H4P9W0_9MICC|nr:helix-turn-helix domain-containing protein [Arthrobacter woluwensis]SEC04018.1 Helix-turn-helix domain-containing protein [Arthrobacter woluwensis]